VRWCWSLTTVFLLDAFRTLVFGLARFRRCERFADISNGRMEGQNERARAKSFGCRRAPTEAQPTRAYATSPRGLTLPRGTKKKLFFQRNREFALMENSIHEAEAQFQQKAGRLATTRKSPATSNKLRAASVELATSTEN